MSTTAKSTGYFPASSLFTASLTCFPSTRIPAPANRAMTFFITAPISFIVGAPISAMTALHSGHNLILAGGLGHVGFDQRDFGSFLVGHFLAAALGELLDGILALFDQRGEDLLRFLVVERRHLFDFAVLERGLDHAQGGQPMLVARLHGGGDVLLNLLGEAHGGIIASDADRIMNHRGHEGTKEAI